MSKSRYLVLFCVLLVGAVWFLYPKSKDDLENQNPAASDLASEREGSAVEVSKASKPSVDAKSVKRSTAQAVKSPAGSANAGGEPPLPGEAALRALQAESVRPWTARRVGAGNGIKTLVRGLWTAGNISDSAASAEAFVRDYSDSLLGVPADQVKFLRQEITDRTKIVYEQNVDGTSVYGGTLTMFFENGGMSRVQNDLFAKSPTLAAVPANFDSDQAFSQFNEREGLTYTNVSGANARTILYPGPTSLVYGYEISVRETATGKTYRVLYNAEDQTLIKKFPSQIQ